MKLNKKTAMLVSFCIGAVVLSATAFADIMSKTGYDQLKDTAKLTAKALSKDVKSFTLEGSLTVKDNGKQLYSMTSREMIDQEKYITENKTSTTWSDGTKNTSYYYRDPKTNIWHDQNTDTYYVTEYTEENKNKTKMFSDPFEEEYAKDVERIFDATVGNLKDYVVVEKNNDGSKTFSGSLTEAQIPALVNAVSSFGFKQIIGQNKSINRNVQTVDFPELAEDVFVKKASGILTTNEAGIVQTVSAVGVLSGKDKSGNVHDISFEINGKISNINSTIISKPDLTDKNVTKNIDRGFRNPDASQAFVGKYANNIVIKNDAAFEKIGQRILELSYVDNKTVKGKYHEEYKDGYDEYKNNAYEFAFEAQMQEGNFAQIEFTNKAGKKESASVHFDTMLGKVYFNIDGAYRNGNMFDSNFIRVFE